MSKEDIVTITATKEELAALMMRVRLSFYNEHEHQDSPLLKLCSQFLSTFCNMSMQVRDDLAVSFVQKLLLSHSDANKPLRMRHKTNGQ